MADITMLGNGVLKDWDSVTRKAADGGIDPNSLYVGIDGVVYGQQAGVGWVDMGRWGGDPSFKTGAPPTAASSGSSSSGGYGPGGIVGGWPWWVFALVIVGAVILIREA